MFKLVGILQASLAVVLTACASAPATQPAAEAPSLAAQAATASPAEPGTRRRAEGSAEKQPEGRAGRQTERQTGNQAESQAEQQAFARQLAADRRIPLAHVELRLGQARYSARVAELIAPPPTARTARSWPVYRQRVVEPARIRAGLEFWRQHQDVLDGSARRHGVPASIIVAIIGVETVYGRHTGGFRVLDTLYTLSFHHPEPARPERVRMFREQLADLIELDYAGQLDATQAKGSFAGAMGLPQFMPGSLKRYARDGDGDTRIDLHGSVPDAIASVANFLVEHGWRAGLPVFAPVSLPADAGKLVAGGLAPTLDWPALQAAGATTATTAAKAGQAGWQTQPLGVIDLADEPRRQVELRTATPNFFAITQYNRSYFYAASVADLAQALEAARAGQARR